MTALPRRALALLLALLCAAPLALAIGPADPPGSVRLPDGALAIPMRADTPAWLTPALQAKINMAGEFGLAYDIVKEQPIPVANVLFIRPGSWMMAPAWCTMNFVYGNAGSYQIGSAGHCTSAGDSVILVVVPGVLASIGNTASSVNGGPGNDWSLVNIRASFQANVDANVADVWGPDGSYTGPDFNVLSPAPTKYSGWGTATPGVPRAGVTIGAIGGAWYCECVISPGDSGGPMLMVTAAHPLGQALGLTTHLVTGGTYTALGTRITVVPATVKSGDLNPLPPA